MSLTGQIAIFLAATVVAVPLFRRFRMSAVLGYLAAGIVVGPWGLGLFQDVESILNFAEFGVVLLLFVIGLELQPSRLWVMRQAVFGAGFAQVAITTAAIALSAHALGQPWVAAIIIGSALSLSSTALILQVLAERGELTARHGRTAFAMLLFQDLAVMPALVVLPMLGGRTPTLDWKTVELPVAALAVDIGAGRYALRPALRVIAATRVQEAFTAAALLVVVGTALLFQSVGLSMALGAFIAGVLLADSEYRHELEADIEPFKGLLLGLFFIAVGMSANLGVLFESPARVLALTLAYLLLKTSAIALAAWITRHDGPTAWRLGVALAGGGEFAFVLLGLAAGQGLMPRTTADLLVIVVTLSMVLSPMLIAGADRLARRLQPAAPAPAFDTIEPDEPRVLIAGFGRFGQIVARVLRARHIRFTALEVSQAQVDFVRRFGNKLYYGDASRLEMLRSAGAEHAQLLVLAIDDVEASVRTAEVARRHFPGLRILARARNRQHAFRLLEAGVTEIWRETFASSLEVAEAALVALGTPRDAAASQVHRFRVHDEETLRVQAAVRDDETRLIATTKASAQQLESLFEADAR
ncbi:MAG: glutathione-regulated potassium-efflux system protein KefB [Gammaproteobacteria bacterium]|nr:glutathione-regulated potassium-efflux system protein KefB [Gammaproteobacteria bacterium]